MTVPEYKEKLVQFNSTPKYKAEIELLLRLMDIREGQKIMDYGCGLGRTVHRINQDTKAQCYGYDIRNFREVDSDFYFRTEYFFKFHKIYFMHSIAHLPDLSQKLDDLKQFLRDGARVYVITPNKLWLNEVKKYVYIPDPTVINHFSAAELQDVFTEHGFKIINCAQFGSIQNNQHERIYLEAEWL